MLEHPGNQCSRRATGAGQSGSTASFPYKHTHPVPGDGGCKLYIYTLWEKFVTLNCRCKLAQVGVAKLGISEVVEYHTVRIAHIDASNLQNVLFVFCAHD